MSLKRTLIAAAALVMSPTLGCDERSSVVVDTRSDVIVHSDLDAGRAAITGGGETGVRLHDDMLR